MDPGRAAKDTEDRKRLTAGVVATAPPEKVCRGGQDNKANTDQGKDHGEGVLVERSRVITGVKTARMVNRRHVAELEEIMTLAKKDFER